MKRTAYRVLIKSEHIDYMLGSLPETMEDLGNGLVASYLTKEQYQAQMSNPDALWKCPVSRECGFWDDEWYETQSYLESSHRRLDSLLKFLESSYRKHDECEDSFYNCAAHPEGCLGRETHKNCDCGADEWNKQLAIHIEDLKVVIAKIDEHESN